MTTAITQYDPVRAKVAELKAKYQATVWIVETPQQMKSAKEARREIRLWKSNGEAARVEAKKESLEHGRRVDAEAKEFMAELLKLEEPVDHAIKEVEAKQEKERQEKADAENKRIEQARQEIEMIRGIGRRMFAQKSVAVQIAIDELTQHDARRQDEFSPLSEQAKAETLVVLANLLKQAQDYEAEQARITAERAELAKLRAEQDERNRIEQEKAAKDTAARVKAESEARAKIEAEERASRERIAKEESEARQLRAKADEEARQDRLKEQARLDVERQKIEAEKKKADEAKRKAEEAKAERERIKNLAIAERSDARTLLKMFSEKYGKVTEFARVTKAIADYFAENK